MGTFTCFKKDLYGLMTNNHLGFCWILNTISSDVVIQVTSCCVQLQSLLTLLGH